MKKKIIVRCLLAVVLLAGCLLRVYQLGRESIWFDEAISIAQARQSIKDIATLHFTEPPAYHVLMHYAMQAGGTSEVACRAPSVVFGCLAIFFVFILGKLLFDETAGLLGALFFSVSVYQVQYAREARMYSLCVLLTVASMYYFVLFIRKKRSADLVYCSVASCILSIAHNTGILLFLAQNSYLCFILPANSGLRKSIGKRWVIAQSVVLAVWLLYWAFFLYEVITCAGQITYWWILQPSLRYTVRMLSGFAGSPLLLLVYCACMLGILNKLLTEKAKMTIAGLSGEIFLFFWLAASFIILAGISKLSFSVYVGKYIIGASVPLYLLAARGIAGFSSKCIRAILIMAIVAGSMVQVCLYYQHPKKEYWRQAAEYISRSSARGDFVLAVSDRSAMPLQYYLQGNDLSIQGYASDLTVVKEDDIKGLAALLRGHDRIWAVFAHCHDPKLMIKKYLFSHYRYAAMKQFHQDSDFGSDIEVLFFEKKSGH